MKKPCVLLLLFLMSVTALHAAKKPIPSDYSITVHVVGSENRLLSQHLEAFIDGKPVELQSTMGIYGGILALGDYQAKSVPTGPKNHAVYDSWTIYEFYFPADGATRQFAVVAIGTPPPAGNGN
jgi:hypothetical protein